MGKLDELLADIGAEALAPDEGARAVAAIDARGTGYIDADAFLEWFHAYTPPDGEAAPAPPEVHPSVLTGLKDDGEATGTGGYDDDLLTGGGARPGDAGSAS